MSCSTQGVSLYYLHEHANFFGIIRLTNIFACTGRNVISVAYEKTLEVAIFVDVKFHSLHITPLPGDTCVI